MLAEAEISLRCKMAIAYGELCKQEVGKSILRVPDTGMSQYWSILEYFWCTSIARKCDPYVL